MNEKQLYVQIETVDIPKRRIFRLDEAGIIFKRNDMETFHCMSDAFRLGYLRGQREALTAQRVHNEQVS